MINEKTDQPHWIIDGYNYILRTEKIDFDSEDALLDARERLVRRLIAFRGQKRQCITIVFDGRDLKGIQRQPRPAGVEVIFSRAPQKADPAILALIQKSLQPRKITLVTSDNSLAHHAAGFGCTILSVEQFTEKMKRDEEETEYRQKYEARLSPDQVDEWLKLFENGEE
ncbi:MAG: NYN domain-containing protein [candidate division KSB1 bacterium]|nr:NYN domain-containing protein [candidate division KSB1 bacterium]MDZ7345988.1 NYN domain-containing protein [candidate division KSB1 bacterium]